MKMIKYGLLSVLLGLGLSAQASIYDQELLADPGFESREGAWGLYYWNEGNSGAADLVTGQDDTNPYYSAGSLQLTGLYSIEISSAGAVAQDFSVNDNRNSNNNFTSDEGVSFTSVNIQNVSYKAGDTIQGSLWVNIDNWSGTGGNYGVGFRIVGQDGPAFIENSPRLTETVGWEQITFDYVLTADYTGVLRYDVIFEADSDGGLVWVDDASMTVIPEPGTMLLLGFGLSFLVGLGRFWRR